MSSQEEISVNLEGLKGEKKQDFLKSWKKINPKPEGIKKGKGKPGTRKSGKDNS